jgi:predicted RNase H-like HicB family nuclease
MQVEVEVHRNELGEWVAVAVAWNVQATGQSENEALARMMEALARHFKTSPQK